MKQIVKVGWVFWIHLERYEMGVYRRVRGANFFELVCMGFRISIGIPWNKHFVRYQLTGSIDKSIKHIVKVNEEMMKAPRLKFRMPKVKYVI